MTRTVFLGLGHYLPDRVVTNAELAQLMDTTDEWIQQRSGIKTRRFVDFDKEPMGSSEMGARAGLRALQEANVDRRDIDLIVYATLSSDRMFPGDGVLVQAKMDIPAGVPALDIRNQCSGFLYGLAVADAFIRCGTYKRILLIGAETHSTGLDLTTRGRDVAVLFGDGGAAAVLGPAPDGSDRGVLSVHLHADGRHADELHCPYPCSAEMPRMSAARLAEGVQYPRMNGRNVFKAAVQKMPEAVLEALGANNLTPQDIDLFIAHQANLRIIEMVQRRLGVPDEKVFNNIEHYGNTTAASIPLALHEAAMQGRIEQGGLLCLTAFGAGYTWGAALVRW